MLVKTNSYHFLLSIALLFQLVSCSEIPLIDNQDNLAMERVVAANPLPASEDIGMSNGRHKILIALIDTGVEYNHPYLQRNIHYETNNFVKPVRCGWDFIGNDPWPAPYIGRTSFNTDYEEEVIRNLIKARKELAEYLDLRRNVVQEYLADVRHGTMVAGIIAQQHDEIGLLPYRFYPPENGQDRCDAVVSSLQLLLEATRKAIIDGAQIINYSTFFCCHRDDAAMDFEKVVEVNSELLDVIRDNQDVLFIMSAGFCPCTSDEGDGQEKIHLPAGLHGTNVLVVGALSEEGEIASFSNIPCETERVVFTIGENIRTTKPQHMADIPEGFARTAPSLLHELREGNETYQSIGDYLLYFAERTSLLTTGSGTSFAAPLVAHLAARIQIAHPEFVAGEVIETILTQTEEFYTRDGRKLKRLSLPKPAWE